MPWTPVFSHRRDGHPAASRHLRPVAPLPRVFAEAELAQRLARGAQPTLSSCRRLRCAFHRQLPFQGKAQ